MKELLMKNRRELAKYIVGSVLSIAINLITTLGLAYIFGILNATTPGETLKIVLIGLGLFLLPPLLFLISRFLRIGFMRDILVDVRIQSFEKLMDLDIQSYREQPREVYLSQMVSDLNLFEKDFFLSLLNIIASAGTFTVGILILWFMVSPILASLTLGVAGILYLISKAYEKAVRIAQSDTQKANVDYNVELSNVLNGMEVMKLYKVEQPFLILAKNIVGTVESIKNRYRQLNGMQTALTQGIAAAFQIFALVYTTYLWTVGDISMSAMVLVFNLMGQLVWGFISLTAFINRFKASLDVYHRLTDRTNGSKSDVVQIDRIASIKVENLGYAYGDHCVLENVTFDIQPNTKLLIYGPSGVGKTTLLNCLAQTLGDYSGSVRVNDNELLTVDHRSYLNTIGYVRQQHFMFEDTIANNVILDQPMDERKLERILRDVDLWDWITGLDLGWDHSLLQNGSNISGGQKQRISIARELYRNCDVLFVDEPSASLDDDTSRSVYETLLSLKRTVVCVSHRHLNYLSERVDRVVNLGGE